MISAAHVDALAEVFSGNAHPITGGVIIGSKIGITSHLLNEYARVLGGNQMFQAWFASAQTANRLILHSANTVPVAVKSLSASIVEYAAASYLSGGNLFVSSSFPAADISTLNSIGTLSIPVNLPIGGAITGDKPIFTINLTNGGSIDFGILKRYFLAEDKIVVYDKYIDRVGVEFVEYIASILRPGASIKVFTTVLGGTNCFAPSAIDARIRAVNSGLAVLCAEVSPAFWRLAHDRYVFCGERLQITFSAGIGLFGKKGSNGLRKNKESDINVYDTTNGRAMDIEEKNGSKHHVKCRV